MSDPWGRLRAALAALDAPRPWGLAVSGGGDSTALLHAAARTEGALRAATVDHGLRAEAADEARAVGLSCRALGIAHEVLCAGLSPGPRLQSRARDARYGLLAEWARSHGLGTVLVAHTADDVAETLLMRLARGSGIDGLARMRARWTVGDQRFDRPFLDLPRATLRDALRSDGIGWIDDPSNSDPAQERARIRAAIAALDLPAEALARSAARLAHARDSLSLRLAEIARDLVRQDGGDLMIGRDGLARLRSAEPEQARRLAVAALRWIGGAPYPPRGADLARLLDAISRGRPATLAGCLALPDGSACRLTRERARAAGPVPFGQDWDGRWRVTAPQGADREGLSVGALGADVAATPWRGTGRPRAALCGTPAVRRGKDLVAAPLAGLGDGWQAEPRVPFHESPLLR